MVSTTGSTTLTRSEELDEAAWGVESPAVRDVLRALAVVHQGLDEALVGVSAAVGPLSQADANAMVKAVGVVSGRVDALQMRSASVVKESRPSARQSEERAVEEASGVLARHTHMDRRQANQWARLAAQLGNHPITGTGGTGTGAPDIAGAAGEGTPAGAGPAGNRPEDTTPGTGGAPAATLRGESSRPSATSMALDAGRISAAHARIIVRALDDLPEGLDVDERDRVEAGLVEQAARMAPGQLRWVARRALAAVEPDQDTVDRHENQILTCEEDQAWDGASFWVKDNWNGTMTGGFTVPFEAGAMLRTVLDAMTSPRRQKNGHASSAPKVSLRDEARNSILGHGGNDADVPGIGSDGTIGSHGGRTLTAGHDNPWAELTPRERELRWQQLRGRAFTELLGHLPTDHLYGQVPATIVVHTDLDTLRSETDRAGVTDAGDKLTAGTIRRLACNAGILPSVLDGDSLPLDLGRRSRCFTPAQRLALAKKYQTCAEQDCDRPFTWTEIHHLTPWKDGGETNLDNAVPLCGRHHRAIDTPDLDHTIHRQPDGTVWIEFHPNPPPRRQRQQAS